MHRQVKIGNRAITIVDASIEHRGQQLDKYVAEYLKFVPREDLIGIGMIVLYDETPDGVPGTRKAGYLRSDPTTREAVIYLYLNWALGYPPYLLTKANSNSINKIREKILLTFLGKGVLALKLFHEIGHHKNTAISPKVYDTEGVAEKDAESYALQLYWKMFPLRCYVYHYASRLVQWVYRKRIRDYAYLHQEYLADVQRGHEERQEKEEERPGSILGI